jgi:hypothetical protein
MHKVPALITSILPFRQIRRFGLLHATISCCQSQISVSYNSNGTKIIRMNTKDIQQNSMTLFTCIGSLDLAPKVL